MPRFVMMSSTQATFLPSGEMAVCSKRCVAESVLMTSCAVPEALGFAAAARRASADCLVPLVCCAGVSCAKAVCEAQRRSNEDAAIASLDRRWVIGYVLLKA